LLPTIGTALKGKHRDLLEDLQPLRRHRRDENSELRGNFRPDAPSSPTKPLPTGSDSDKDDAAVLSRRDVLAGIGVVGLFAVAGSTLLVSTGPAEARIDTPAIEPETAQADAAKAEVAECSCSKDIADFTEFSSQWRLAARRSRSPSAAGRPSRRCSRLPSARA
jgi:hypothetical protein